MLRHNCCSSAAAAQVRMQAVQLIRKVVQAVAVRVVCWKLQAGIFLQVNTP